MNLLNLGDIALVGDYDLTKNPDAGKKVSYLREISHDTDFRVANLEAPFTDLKRTWICKSFHLRSDPINVKTLNDLNIDAVTLANNHVMDFGRKGFEQTIRTLEANHIEWFGADGKTLEKQIGDQKIRFSGFCCYAANGVFYSAKAKSKGIHLLTLDNLLGQLKKDQQEGYFSVFAVHWGAEHTHYPLYEYTTLFRKLSSHGRLLLCGHHPHVIQGIQERHGAMAAYSLGNCVFGETYSLNGKVKLVHTKENNTGVALQCRIEDGRILDHQILGFQQEDVIAGKNINGEMDAYSAALDRLSDRDREQYEKLQKLQSREGHDQKFGAKDLSWVLSRLNYYNIGNRILAIPRKKKRIREFKKFL